MNTQAARLTGFLIATLLAVSACGGSSGGGAVVSPPPPPPPPPPVGGITRSGAVVAVGPVTAFGSVVVNGVTYDTSAADFTVDGQSGFQTDLNIGDIVVVKGTIDDDNTNAVAESVEFDDSVEGPVSSVVTSVVPNTMVVLGQTVTFEGAIFDDSCPADPNLLLTVAAVQVSGQTMDDGTIDATRIECKNVLGEAEITGIVTAATGGTTFEIGALTVDFSSVLMMENFPGGRPVEIGDLVEAKGSVGSPTLLNATTVEFKGDRLLGDDGDHVEVEGFITSFNSPGDFVVSNLTAVNCDTSAGCTVTTQGAPGGTLGQNLKVEVKGEYVANVLVATSVDIRLGNAVRITALVDDVNPPTGDVVSVVLLGITVNTIQGRTRFDDKTGAVGDSFNVSDIAPGDYVRIRGQEFPAGSGEILATIVERDELRAESIIQGFIDTNGVNRPMITVLGVIIGATDGVTVYTNNDESVITDPNLFWGAISDNSLIKAKGTVSVDPGPPEVVTLTAEEIEIQME